MRKQALLLLTMGLLVSVPFLTTNKNEVSASNIQSSNLVIKNFDSSNGLTTSEANSVLSSKDGYVWVGCYGGLIKYDGKEFTNYSKSDEFGVTGIRYVSEDSNGVVYIATNEKGLFSYENGKFNEVFTSDKNHVPTAVVLSKEKGESLYAGCYSSVYEIKDKVATKLSTENVYGNVYSLSIDKNNVIWGCDDTGSLFGIKDGKEFFYSLPASIPHLPSGERIYSVLASNDTLYLGSSKQNLLTIKFNNGNYNLSEATINDYSVAPLYSVNRIVKSENNLWLATSAGCGYLDNNMAVNTNDELQVIEKGNDIEIDYQNNIWFASQKNGAYEATSGSYSHVVNIANLKNNAVNAVMKRDNKYFIGTDSGLIITDENFNNETTHDIISTIGTNRVRNISKDKDNNLWISSTTYHKELMRLNSNFDEPMIPKFLEKYTENGITVRSSIELSNGNIAVGATNGLHIINPSDGSLIGTAYNKTNGLENTFILSLVEYNDELLIGTDGGGLFKLKDGVISKVLTKDGETLGTVLKIYKDGDEVWLSSSVNLYKYKNAELTEINLHGVSSGSILDIYSINGKLCLLENDGIYILKKLEVTLNSVTQCSVFDSKQGLPGNITSNSFSYLDNNILYTCTTKGLSYIDLSSAQINAPLPKIHVNKITYELDEKDYQITDNFENIAIPKEAIKIRIEYCCLNYSLEDTYVCYQLKGLENSATKVLGKGTGEISYPTLAGGEYEFVLFLESQHETGDGTIKFNLKKNYKWYEKTLDIALVSVSAVLFIIGMLLLFGILRIKKIKKEKLRYKEITNEALSTIANTIDAKDKYTNGHSHRVALYSVAIAKRLGMSEEELEKVHYVALLHDIGKIGVPDAILNKPGKLTDEEYEAIQKHTVIGGNILRDFKMIDNISDGAIGHHEKYDGTGYPNHKKGDENPLIARIISVADTYDAMASTRPYRNGMSPEFCIEQLEKGKGTQFDPELAEIMIQIIKDGIDKIYSEEK